MVTPHSIQHWVRGYDCGYGGPLRPLSLANWLQEAAGDHATELGIGMAAMFAANRTWMLSRIDTHIKRPPREGERIVVRTWPSGFDRLFALRCFDIRAVQDAGDGQDCAQGGAQGCAQSAAGELLAGAVYAYLIVDFATRRPLRPERSIQADLHCPQAWPFDDLAPGTGERVSGEFGVEHSFSIQAMPRHIDHNGHVNNAHLIDWLCDAVPRQNRGKGQLARLKVDFLAEALEGDTLALSWKLLSDGGMASIAMRGDTAVARAWTQWM